MDNLEFDAEITDVKWPTNTKGQLNPILVLNKEFTATKDKDEQVFDGIAFKNFEDIQTMKCGIGSKVKITCSDQLVPNISFVYKTSDKFKYPKNCMYCREEVYGVDKKIFCINHLCIAQGRSPIFKLFILSELVSLDKKSVVDIHQYLDAFPYLGSTSKIEHIYGYLKHFQAVKDSIGTDARKKLLEENLEEAGSGMWLWESTLKNTLRKGIEASNFWYLLGLPFKEDDLKKINKLDVFKDGLSSKKIKKLNLSEHGKRVVEDNTQVIKLIYPELAALRG